MKIKLSLSEIRFNSIILMLLARAPKNALLESEVIELAERSKWLSADMRASVPSRSDSRIANKVHNQVSHRTSRGNLIQLGLIGWCHHLSSFTLQEKGRQFLSDVAAKLGATSSSDLSVVDDWLTRTAA